MRPAYIVFAACLFLYAAPLSPAGNDTTRSQLLRERLLHRQENVNRWESQATVQIALAITVGLLGLAVGALQKSDRPRARDATVAAGLIISAITVCTNIVFSADHRMLLKSVDLAKPILEDLSDMLVDLDRDESRENQLAIEADFKAKCGRIDEIALKLRSGQAPDFPAFSWTSAVYAQSKAPRQPAWVSAGQRSDEASTYFVGEARGPLLAQLKTESLDRAVEAAARWVLRSQGNTEEPSRQALEMVRSSGEVAATWFAFDPASRTYRYCTRLRLSNEFKTVPLNRGSRTKG
jgi:hypothetical protein